jgi:hypothetical protein
MGCFPGGQKKIWTNYDYKIMMNVEKNYWHKLRHYLIKFGILLSHEDE